MLDGADQAAGLRQLVGRRAVSVLAFGLGDADAGCLAPVAHALRALGRRPVVLDAHRGAAAAALGLRLHHDLLELMRGQRGFDAVAGHTADGVCALRCEHGIDAAALQPGGAARLLRTVAALDGGFDDLLLAMPAAELASVVDPARSVPVLELRAGQAGRVACYALIKQLAGFGWRRFACVVRGADPRLAAQEHAVLAHTSDAFLGAELSLAGALPAGPAGHGDAAARAADTLIRTAAAAA